MKSIFTVVDDKIDFATRFVAPVKDAVRVKPAPQAIQNQMFPQNSSVLTTNAVPPLDMHDKTRIESVALGPGGDFPISSSMKGRQQKNGMREAHRFDTGSDGWITQAAQFGQTGIISQSALCRIRE